jgi:asparagine synthase (glutamine-hydrolysing)
LLRLARAPLSQQPLHLWHEGDRLVAATIPRMIHAVAGIPRVLDRRHLEDTLLLNLRADRRSWYERIERLPAGSTLTIDRGRRVARRYWSVDTIRPVRFRRDDDYVEAVEEQFRRAARSALEDLAKPAVSLSGGLDSQAVTSFLLDALPAGARLPTWTAVPHRDFTLSSEERLFADEGRNVRALAAMHAQLEPRFVTGFEGRLGERLDAMFLLGDCPTHNEFNMHWAHEIAAQAAAAGCDALIGGDAGNMTFSYDGMTGYPTWFRQGRWLHLLREVRAMPDGRPLWRRLFSRAVMPNLPLAWRAALARRRAYWYRSPFDTWCPMRGAYAESSGATRRVAAEGHDVAFLPSRSARDWRFQVLAAVSNEGPEIDIGTTLLHGIPYRDPTAYRPFVELTFGIPDEQFLRSGETRWLARRLLKGRIPDDVRRERRTGLQAADWPLRLMRDRPAILAELAELARDPAIAEVIDLEWLSRTLGEWDGSDRATERFAHALKVSVSRGLATARFIRFAEGRNLG